MGNGQGGGEGEEYPSPGLVGLHNFDNTCYMNAGIQCLAHTPVLVAYFLRLYDSHEFSDTSTTTTTNNEDSSSANATNIRLAYEFARLIDKIWMGKCEFVKPEQLKLAVDNTEARFRGVSKQHDAFEFLLEVLMLRLHRGVLGIEQRPVTHTATYVDDTVFIDDCSVTDEVTNTLGEHVCRVVFLAGASDQYDQFKWMVGYSKVADNAQKRWTQVKGVSVFTSNFYGQYRKCVKCNRCDSVSVSFPTFSFIDLPLHVDDAGKVSVHQLMHRLAATTTSVAHKCPKCATLPHQEVTGELNLRVWRLPRILMCRLARVQSDGNGNDVKLTQQVAYVTRGLNMRQYMMYTQGVLSNDTVFDLYAVLQHYGTTPQSGHYVAEVQHHANGWFYAFDDSCVTRVEESLLDSVVRESSEAYVLFYHSRSLQLCTNPATAGEKEIDGELDSSAHRLIGADPAPRLTNRKRHCGRGCFA